MVSGGPTVQENQLITPALIDEMERYTAFAPLHTPIADLHHARGSAPLSRRSQLRHSRLPTSIAPCPKSSTHMPIPAEYSAMGVRRYGAHGISYESIVYQLQPNVPEKLIVAHLGNGASISAIRNGKCLDTSMGLTPTGGIISGTRTGDIDPGVLLFILRKIAENDRERLEAADQLEAVASKKAGLLGVSDLSNDMRDLREAIKDGNAKARLAVDKFIWTIAKWIGSYFAELGGLDMLVFTGGIGENDIAIARRNLRRPRRTRHRARPSPQQRARRSRHLRREFAGHGARDSARRRPDHREPCGAAARKTNGCTLGGLHLRLSASRCAPSHSALDAHVLH